MHCEDFDEIIKYFPESLRILFSKIPRSAAEEITEIRLRKGRQISVVARGETLFVAPNGRLSPHPDADFPVLSDDETETVFSSLCGNSVYSHGDELAEGYIAFGRGARAGVCGRAVYSGGKISALRDISSFNIRVAKQIKGIGERYFRLAADGLLIAGAPATGKTTLLRDIIRLLSLDGKRVAVVDSRNELAAAFDGKPLFDLGPSADVLSGYGKADGVETAVRTLAPQIIAFDEFSTAGEYREIAGGAAAGVAFVCTVHGSSVRDLLAKRGLVSLLKKGVFKNILLLKNIGASPEVLTADEIPKDGGTSVFAAREAAAQSRIFEKRSEKTLC